MEDLYYRSNLVKKYNPELWGGFYFQENAGLQEMYARVNALNPELVIDAGCGRNSHKQHIKNLIGFDASPYPEVDLNCAILDAPFEPSCADAVLALGSVQYINKEYILENIDRVISWVKPGGVIEMRVMFDNDFSKYYHSIYDKSARFPWSNELREEVRKKYKLDYVVEPWTYSATASDDLLEKKHQAQQNAVNKGIKSQRWLENQKMKDQLFQKLSRQCWTWRKNHE